MVLETRWTYRTMECVRVKSEGSIECWVQYTRECLPRTKGWKQNSPTYHLSHDPLGDFVVPIPRTLGSAVRSPIFQREALPESGREQQARRGIPIMAE